MDEGGELDRRQESRSYGEEHREYLRDLYTDMFKKVRNGEMPQDLFVQQLSQDRLRLESLIETDPLTGIKNRRGLDWVLDHALKAAKEKGESVGFLRLDFDHFKTFNDTYGHDVGDKVLFAGAQIFADVIKDHKTWTVGRYGGEEFDLVMPGATDTELVEVAEKIGTVVRDELAGRIGLDEQKITMSIGGCFLKSEETASDLKERADNILYKAKRQDSDGKEGRKRAFVEMGTGEVVEKRFA